MSSARVSRALYRSILKEIRSLTLAKGRRVLLLEEPDHRKWGHGQVDGCFAWAWQWGVRVGGHSTGGADCIRALAVCGGQVSGGCAARRASTAGGGDGV